MSINSVEFSFFFLLQKFSYSQSVECQCDSNDFMTSISSFNDSIWKKWDTFVFKALLRLAEMNDQLRDWMVNNYGIDKFHIHEMVIYIQLNDDDEKPFEITPKYCRISDIATAKRFLHIFGHLISNLTIDDDQYVLRSEGISEIMADVSEYCSESLKQVWVADIVDWHWRRPFNKLEDLSGVDKCDNDYSKIFPSLRKLEIKDILPMLCFTTHFPNLEYLKATGSLNLISYERMFELNPQVTGIEAYHIREPSLLRVINEKLENLEYVDFRVLSCKGVESDVIHFKKVNNYKLDFSNVEDEPGVSGCELPFFFDQLEKMEFNLPNKGDHPNEKIVEFITKHKNIKSLTILNEYSSARNISLQKLISIAENLPNLVEFKTNWIPQWHTDDLIFLIFNKNMNLKIITITDMPYEVRVLLKYRVQPEWQIENYTFIRSESH